MQNQNKLNFKQKAEQIKCTSHHQQIIQLNINKEAKLGERLVCRDCEAIGKSVISIGEVDQYLNIWWQRAQEILSKDQAKITEMKSQILKQQNQIIKQLRFYFECLKKKFLEVFEKWNTTLMNYQSNLDLTLSQNSSKSLMQLISDFQQSDSLSAQNIQEIAQILSKLDINQIQSNEKIIPKLPQNKKMDYGQIELAIDKLNQVTILLQNSIKNQYNQYFISLQSHNIQIKKQELIQLKEHQNQICAIDISKDDQLIGSGDKDGIIILWNLEKQLKIQQFKAESQIIDLKFSYDGKKLAASPFKQPYSILIFDISQIEENQQPSFRLQGHNSIIWRVEFTLNDKFLISGSQDKTLKVWSLQNNQIIHDKKLSYWINCVNISSNQAYIAACCGNGKAYLFDYSQQESLDKIAEWTADERVYCTTFTPDSRFLLTSYETIKLWSIQQLQFDTLNLIPLKTFQGDAFMWNIQILLGGSLIISNDNQIKVWNLKENNLLYNIKVPDGYQYVSDRNFKFTQNLKYCVTGGYNKVLKIYNFNY